MPIFIIEHLEPKLHKWCVIEYRHISKIVGKTNLWFTNVKKGGGILRDYGKVIKKSVLELDLKNACILDPEAKIALSSKDKFNFYVFGGILGDYPPKKRTKVELTSKINAESRNIGKRQMSTDNAVYVVKKIVEGTNISRLKFHDKLEIPLGKNESTILPYLYAVVNGKPLVSNELVKYLKNKKGF